MPAVSVITPTYNAAAFIADTIRSVQAQTFPDWEMILVDDASTDETAEIVAAFAGTDSRLKLIRLERNSGTGVARDTATNAATGRYIAFLDADDLWKPEKLEKQLEDISLSGKPFSFSFYDCMDEAGRPLGIQVTAPRNLRYFQLFCCNFVGNLTGMYDTAYFGKIRIASIRKRQDWMLWLTILKKIRSCRPIPESLAIYRIREGSISSSKRSLLKHNFAVYRRFHGYSAPVALCCLGLFLFAQLLIKPFYRKRLKE
jgi:teichuronic acid biosynthesis glycosyltransferase TuaG